MDPGLTALLAVGLATYAGYILKLSALGLKLVAIATIILVALINIRGVKLGAGFVRTITFLKLGLLAFVFLWGVGFQLGDWSNFTPFVARPANSAPLIGALAGGMMGAFFSFAGWWDLGKLAGEVNNPGRALPRALAYGVTIVTIVYVLTSFAFVYLVPLDQVTSGETFAAQAGEVLFGRAGGLIFSLVVVISVLGSITAIVLSAPRVYFAMARDGLFIPSVATLHKRYETPARAIALQALLATVLVIAGNFREIMTYFMFVVVLFVALSVAALFKFRRDDSNGVRFLTPGYPFTPIAFLVMMAVTLFLLAADKPRPAFRGVLVVALGFPVYLFLFRSKRLVERRTTQ
jgi:APA family basic amino acid/polyamine antiporter